MTEEEQVKRFADELDALIERYSKEYDLAYASVLGALEMKKWTLCSEAAERRDDV